MAFLTIPPNKTYKYALFAEKEFLIQQSGDPFSYQPQEAKSVNAAYGQEDDAETYMPFEPTIHAAEANFDIHNWAHYVSRWALCCEDNVVTIGNLFSRAQPPALPNLSVIFARLTPEATDAHSQIRYPIISAYRVVEIPSDGRCASRSIHLSLHPESIISGRQSDGSLADAVAEAAEVKAVQNTITK